LNIKGEIKMLKVTDQNGNKYEIFFRYYDEESGRLTYCTILDENKNVLTRQKAVCKKPDIFNKNVGRKLSLSRALKDLTQYSEETGREFRRNIWNQYFNMRGKFS
jgi:hypothetical protein